VLDEIKIQPLFAKPLAFTKISIHESDIQIIKDLEYKQIEPDGFQSVDDMIWDRLPDLTRDIEHQVKAFNDNVMFYQTPIKMTRMWGTKFLPGQQGEVHYHKNSTYSFVLYLDEGMSCQFQSFGQEELFDPKYDKYNIFNMKSFDMPVERGTLLIFKSSLPHKVMKTNNERYSVAGNFIVTDLKDFNIV
jgi:hypothetical protein|tara:strand:- start:199 stop:765 length:567 start_codon:yes stop_codon:yes gene_type:complete